MGPVCILAVLFPTKLPANSSGKAIGRCPICLSSCHPHERPRPIWCLLVSAFPSPGHGSHLGIEPVDETSLFNSSSPFGYISDRQTKLFWKKSHFFSPWFFRLSNRPSDKLLQCSKQKGQSQPETQSLNLKPGFSTGCGAPRYLSHFYAFQNPEIHGGFRHSDVGIHGLTHVLTTRWKTHPFCTSFQCWTITSKFGIFDFFKLLTWSNFFPNENLSMM